MLLTFIFYIWLKSPKYLELPFEDESTAYVIHAIFLHPNDLPSFVSSLYFGFGAVSVPYICF